VSKKRKSSAAARSQRQPGFTLIELLVVIGLMALLMAFAIPAFQGMGRASAMNSAVFQLRSSVALARQWAISQRQLTYVIFPDVRSATGVIADKASRAYIPWTEEDGALGQWRDLPNGIVIDTNFNPRATVRKQLWTISQYDKTLETDIEGLSSSFRAVSFRADGGLGFINADGDLRRGDAVEIILSEGFLEQTAIESYRVVLLPVRVIFSLDINSLTGGSRILEYDDFL
jgi:prepilin-type N-terminal cleavage/methylation domain-containing protein